MDDKDDEDAVGSNETVWQIKQLKLRDRVLPDISKACCLGKMTRSVCG